VIDDVIEKHGGQSVMTKAGHSFIKERMIQEQAVLAAKLRGIIILKTIFIWITALCRY